MQAVARGIVSSLLLFSLVVCDLGDGSVVQVKRPQEERETGRMWNGTWTTYDKHPYFAALTYDYATGIRPGCGGAFITPQIVLTAAHCLQVEPVSIRYGIDVAQGMRDQSDELGRGIDVNVSKLFVHPAFNPKGMGKEVDVGLVKLVRPIEHRSFLINLPEPQEYDLILAERFNITIVAMGISKYDDPSFILKESQITQAYPCTHNETCCTLGHFICHLNQTFATRPGSC